MTVDLKRIQIRRGTTAEWTEAAPIPALGELVLDTTTGLLRVGDGVTAFLSLPIISNSETIGSIVSVAGEVSLANYGGTAQAITADTTESAGDVSIGAGFKITFRVQSTNTAADPTLALNGGDAYPIKENGGGSLTANALIPGRNITMRLTGSSPNQRWEIISNQNTIAAFNNKARRAFVHLSEFGTNTTPGTTNMTSAVEAMHAFANDNGLAVSYAGVGRILIDTDAEIVINTDVDFSGAIIQGNEPSVIAEPETADVVTMFLIEDEDTPLVTGTATGVGLTSSNLEEGSLTAAADYFSGPGHVTFGTDNGVPVPNRARDAAGVDDDQWRQSLWVGNNGKSVWPLARDLSDATSISYATRAMPALGYIEITGATIDLDTFNHCEVFRVQRNCVSITNSQAVPGAAPVSDSLNRLIYVEGCGQVHVERFTSVAQDAGSDGGGTYVMRLRDASEIYLDQITAFDGWGQMASDQVNGLYVTRSRLNRVDTHGISGNIFVDGCTLNGIGVIYGAGYGFLKVSNSTAIDCPVISTRGDYGGYWWGEIISLNSNSTGEGSVRDIIDMKTNPVGVSGFTLPLAHSITIDGYLQDLDESVSSVGETVFPLQWEVAEGTVWAPDIVALSNIKGYRMRVNMELAYGDMTRRNAGTVPQLICSHIHGTKDFTSLNHGIRIPNGSAGDFRIEARFDNCTEMMLNTYDYDGIEIKSNNCTWRGIRTATTALVQSDNDEFLDAYLSGVETEIAIGGTGNVEITNARFNSDWDLSGATLLQGVRIGDNCTLPTDLTERQAFTGWEADLLAVEEWVFTLDDDTARKIDLPYYAGSGNHFYTFLVIADRPFAQGIFTARAGGDAIYELSVDSALTINATMEPLTGTTGADTDLSIAVHTTGGVASLYIENRKGGPQTFKVKLISEVPD